ncbi:MAG: hypothetical protein QS748_06070 [Candidatus Endonucleobacter bathymodioli]|uniref:Uncharacterized protein n=1 Tax=Candidatus Endonucleibacter bathymodioli TaxID=539814 RepID=A0AA90NT19_9GAMM|nr:hypothetical protein [Candidatus Endonucleobacter bathymodioli]
MDAISFTNGLSSISTVQQGKGGSDFPKSKTSLRTPGENVIAYTWRALDYGKTFENREKRFALSPSGGGNQVLTPEEHKAMTSLALNALLQHISKGPEIKHALDILQESKELQESLQMSRNVLHAA